MCDKGLANGDAEVERVMERVDANKDGGIDFPCWRSASCWSQSFATLRGPTPTWSWSCALDAWSTCWRRFPKQ